MTDSRLPARRSHLILGAGVSGLAAAQTLREAGRDFRILERAPSLGGLTRTIEAGDFAFDYTGHFLHLARAERPSELPYAGLDDRDWECVEKRAACLIGGALVPAPVQYNMGALPEAHRGPAIASYEARGQTGANEAATFRDWVVSGFGAYLADLFLIPQNERTMRVRLEDLSPGALKRFFPAPDDARVRNGILGSPPKGTDYNSRFWYPKVGGIGRLADGLSRGLPPARSTDEAAEASLKERTLTTRSGEKLAWDAMFSSVPLKALCAMSDDPDLRAWSGDLTHSSTVVFNLGVRGPLRADLRDKHWIYVPDAALPFYRVGFYSNVSAGVCPAGSASLYAEVALRPEELAQADIAGDLQTRVLAGLKSLGWIDAAKIECVAISVIPCAYVHHTPMRERLVPEIVRRLNAAGIFPIGRYGLWDYISIEDSIHSGIDAARGILR